MQTESMKLVLLLLVGGLRLWWDAQDDDGALLHIHGSGHDQRQQFTALIPRL